MRRFTWTILLTCGALLACDDEDSSAEPATQTCAERTPEFIARCPPGSDPSVTSTSVTTCETGELTDEDGAVTGICEVIETCVLACNFVSPCECGIESATSDGIVCRQCEG